MVTVADIKRTVPGWPDEVIGEWLLYFANEQDVGWPPPVPFGNHRWGRLLGNRPLSWWSEVTWKPERVDCSFDELSDRTKDLVSEIITNVRLPATEEITNKRYNQAFKFIMDNGVFPKPMTAMHAADGLSFLDGHHRLAAFTNLQKLPEETFAKHNVKKPKAEQDVWIGVHLRGELPQVD